MNFVWNNSHNWEATRRLEDLYFAKVYYEEINNRGEGTLRSEIKACGIFG